MSTSEGGSQPAKGSQSVREAAHRFLEDLDELVVQARFERIAKAISVFLGYLVEREVTQVSSLKMEHVEEFLFVGFGGDEVTRSEAEDVWHSVKRFLKWLQQRELSTVYEAFSRQKRGLRQRFKALSAWSSSGRS